MVEKADAAGVARSLVQVHAVDVAAAFEFYARDEAGQVRVARLERQAPALCALQRAFGLEAFGQQP